MRGKGQAETELTTLPILRTGGTVAIGTVTDKLDCKSDTSRGKKKMDYLFQTCTW